MAAATEAMAGAMGATGEVEVVEAEGVAMAAMDITEEAVVTATDTEVGDITEDIAEVGNCILSSHTDAGFRQELPLRSWIEWIDGKGHWICI